MKLFIATDGTEYELPIAIADTAVELAKMVGVTPDRVYHGVADSKRGRSRRYVSVEIGEDDDNSNTDNKHL